MTWDVHADRVRAVLRAPDAKAWWGFDEVRHVLRTDRLAEVLPTLLELEERVRSDRLYAVGFLAYEAAPAFDAALPSHDDPEFPLLWFGLFAPPTVSAAVPKRAANAVQVGWSASLTQKEYEVRIARILDYIRAGDTYQANFTYRLKGRFEADPFDLFVEMAGDGRAPYAAYVDTGEWAVCSASPELFLRFDGRRIESRPMKGTAPRGLWHEQDVERRQSLLDSEKERAENLMIVDMVRNDLGRVAEPGSVAVPALFDVERYPTVWQMTSTVEARTTQSLTDIIRATFPPASITGAPKRRTMEIIKELEDSPRRVYTGAVGMIDPEGSAQFSVAIRTALCHRPSRSVEYGVGGGVVWDSDPALEWEETRAKARVLNRRPAEFDLIETMLWREAHGCELLPYHLSRLQRSAEYFGFAFDRDRILEELARATRGLGPGSYRVRLRLGCDGAPVPEVRRIDPSALGYGRVALAKAPIDADDVFLYHKTTHRQVYESALHARPGFDDVVLFNTRGEATESTVANLAAEIDGRLCTPPIECGLLPGVMRSALLDQGFLAERIVRIDELLRSPRVLLMNAVRGIQPIRIEADQAD